MGTTKLYWEKETDAHIFFWGGVFSNWYKVGVRARLTPTAEDATYNCVEQYFMVQKALAFNDYAAAARIKDTPDPRDQKAIGRTVNGYTDQVWDRIARDVVYPGVYAKFTQSEMLKSLLLGTEGKVLVEASPFDKKWGVGLSTDNIAIEDPANWRGTNWLGQCLMRARAAIGVGVDDSFETFDWSVYDLKQPG